VRWFLSAGAGADLQSWVCPELKYDILQLAALTSGVEATLKLVEAGARWQLPRGRRTVDGTLHYPPDILCARPPKVLKVSCWRRVRKMFHW
jgi:hypothetical protein